ncbi:unnamed protein product [Discosporangium mesarthrocarpum]
MHRFSTPQMSSRNFEGVLHPIFQEDEFTLIVAGGVLGALAGFAQMLLSTKSVREAATKAAATAAAKAVGATEGVGAVVVGGGGDSTTVPVEGNG